MNNKIVTGYHTNYSVMQSLSGLRKALKDNIRGINVSVKIMEKKE